MVKKKVGSITLAVGLITVGALLFSKNFIDIPIKDIYKYWPVLLIGLGLEMVLFTVLYGSNNSEIKLSVDGLCIVFILVLGAITQGITLINLEVPGHFYMDFNGIGYRTEIKENYSRDNISANYNVKELKVRNKFGDIKVLPSEAKNIKVKALVRVSGNDENKARAYAKDAIEITEGEITEIAPKRTSDANKKDLKNAQIDFTIFVPGEINVDIENSFGDIDVEGIGGNCTIAAKSGEVEASDIRGDVHIDNSFGDIKAEGIKGKAEIIGKNGGIKIKEVAGSAYIKNSFGDIDVAGVDGDLEAGNSNGDIIVKNIKGKAEISGSFGDVNVRKVDSDIKIKNSSGGIEAREINGNASINNSFGDIYFSSDNINNSDINAKTDFGDINCDKSLNVSKNGQQKTAQGKLGTGKYKIELITVNGDINIE